MLVRILEHFMMEIIGNIITVLNQTMLICTKSTKQCSLQKGVEPPITTTTYL